MALRTGVLVACAAVSAGLALAYDNGVAKTPPMGWNSWNHFHGSVSAEVLATTADAFVALGLKDAGYEFINTDDCWSELGRDNKTGRIIPAPNFGGTEAAMKNLSAYIKSRGMKFGIYGAAGQTTCAGRAGGLYHEYIDAATYAEWGAEYLKYDDCGQNNINSYAKFSAMRDGLNRTGIPIVFSYEPHLTKPIAWTRYVGNLWRTGHDIGSNFGSMFSELVIGNSWASLGGPGNWNDDDMLEVGNKGLTIAEQRTHFALWCMVKSPLLIGSDVRSIASDSLALLKNKELIAINQDALGVQAALTAVYDRSGGENLLRPTTTAAAAAPAAAAQRAAAFATNSSAMTTCDYGPGPAPSAQRWSFVPVSGGSDVMIRNEAPGAGPTEWQCLKRTSSGPRLVACAGGCPMDGSAEGEDCHWDISSGYSGENGNKGRANETTAQIKSPDGKSCLKFSAPSRGGSGLTMEPCNTDPQNCVVKRCFYSDNLGDEMWYRAANGQLIASFVRGNGHQIPPLSDRHEKTSALFHGPFAGKLPDSSRGNPSRCGNMRGAKEFPGVTPMCKNCTDDGRLYVSLDEMESRCAADAHCAGFSQDTKDGKQGGFYPFRPHAKIVSLGNDPKWATWTKGPEPPSPAPAPAPPAPGPPTPQDWYDQVDVPFCLATAPSASPPKEPAAPPPITASLNCDAEKPTLLVFAGPLSGGKIAVGLVNKCTGSHRITATWKDIGAKAGASYAVRDAVAHKDLPDASGTVGATVGEHDISVLVLTPK